MTSSVYTKVFLVFNFDTESHFWTQIRHRMSFMGDISGHYIPENDISGQATKNAFRGPQKCRFWWRKVIKKIPRNIISGKEKQVWSNMIYEIWFLVMQLEMHSRNPKNCHFWKRKIIKKVPRNVTSGEGK